MKARLIFYIILIASLQAIGQENYGPLIQENPNIPVKYKPTLVNFSNAIYSVNAKILEKRKDALSAIILRLGLTEKLPERIDKGERYGKIFLKAGFNIVKKGSKKLGKRLGGDAGEIGVEVVLDLCNDLYNEYQNEVRAKMNHRRIMSRNEFVEVLTGARADELFGENAWPDEIAEKLVAKFIAIPSEEKEEYVNKLRSGISSMKKIITSLPKEEWELELYRGLIELFHNSQIAVG